MLAQTNKDPIDEISESTTFDIYDLVKLAISSSDRIVMFLLQEKILSVFPIHFDFDMVLKICHVQGNEDFESNVPPETLLNVLGLSEYEDNKSGARQDINVGKEEA